MIPARTHSQGDRVTQLLDRCVPWPLPLWHLLQMQKERSVAGFCLAAHLQSRDKLTAGQACGLHLDSALARHSRPGNIVRLLPHSYLTLHLTDSWSFCMQRQHVRCRMTVVWVESPTNNSLTPPPPTPHYNTKANEPKRQMLTELTFPLQALARLPQQQLAKGAQTEEPSSPSQTAIPRLEVAQQSKLPIIYFIWMLLPHQPHQFFTGAAPCQKYRLPPGPLQVLLPE